MVNIILSKSERALFIEIQRFKQKWIWFAVIACSGPIWYGFICQIILGKSLGDKPAPDILLWLFFLLFGIGLPWFMFSLKLIVQVKKDGLHIQFFPLKKFLLNITDIKSYKYREYKPIKEYGGWGIKYSSKHGKAYNVSGNKGVQLEITNNKKILIGSQDPHKLINAIDTAISYNK